MASSRSRGHVLPVPMDGNCLFHSALRELGRVGLAGNCHSAAALRKALLDWVETHGKVVCADLQLATWIELETDEDLASYCARLKRDGQWGGTIELFALAELFGVTACVWEPLLRDHGGWRYQQRHTFAGGSASSGASAAAKAGASASCADDGASLPSMSGSSPDTDAVPPTVHLHYNGSSHYSIFVPDEELGDGIDHRTEVTLVSEPTGAIPSRQHGSCCSSTKDEHETRQEQPPCPAPVAGRCSTSSHRGSSHTSATGASIAAGGSSCRGESSGTPGRNVMGRATKAAPRAAGYRNSVGTQRAISAALAAKGRADFSSAAAILRPSSVQRSHTSGGVRAHAPRSAASSRAHTATTHRHASVNHNAATSRHHTTRAAVLSSRTSSRNLPGKRSLADLGLSHAAVKLGLRVSSAHLGHANGPREVRV